MQPAVSGDAATHRNEPPAESLHLSVVRGSVRSVKDCLKAGVYVDAKLKGGWSPLMFACSLGHAEIVECLLQYGSNPNFRKGNFTPLMAACTSIKEEKRLLECVKLLVHSGADVNARDVHQHTAVMYAAKEGHAQIVGYLLQHEAHVSSRDGEGRTALFWAINNGHLDVVRVLLQADALNFFTRDEFLPSDLKTISAKKMGNFFPNDTNNNNNKRSCLQNGHITKNKETSVFFKTNEALLKTNNSNANEIILKDVLSKLEELKRHFYQQYAAVYYVRLRLDCLPKSEQPRLAATKRLAAEVREATAAAECVFHNLRFLHSSTVELSECEAVKSATETTKQPPEQWSSLIVTIGIVAVTLFKTKLFGLLGK